jgi:hypothetical protein
MLWFVGYVFGLVNCSDWTRSHPIKPHIAMGMINIYNNYSMLKCNTKVLKCI